MDTRIQELEVMLEEMSQERDAWIKKVAELDAVVNETQNEREALAEALKYPSNASWGIEDGSEFLYAIGQRLMELGEKDLARVVFLKADKEKAALAILKKE